MARILITELLSLATLSLLTQGQTRQQKMFHRLVRSLRREHLGVADVKADLIEGIAMRQYPEIFSRDLGRVHAQAKFQLSRAAASADDLKLLPSALAARDELARLAGEEEPAHLDGFLLEQGVVHVPAFARLYRGARE